MKLAMKIKHQSISGFFLVILILVIILTFLILTLHTVRGVMENRRQIDALINDWYLVKLHTVRMLVPGAPLIAASEYGSIVACLRNRLTRVVNLNITQILNNAYPDFRALIISLGSSWPDVDKRLAGIEATLTDRNSATAVQKGASPGLRSSYYRDSGPQIYAGQILLHSDRFDRSLRDLTSWLDEYSERQLHAFQLLFYLFGTAIVLIALLLIPLSMEFEHRRIAEVQMRSQLQAAINAQEEERKKISLDLHDRLAQELSAAKFSAESLLNGLTADTRDVLKSTVSRIITSLQKSIDTTRSIAYDLRPPYLDHLGLVSALRSLLLEIENRNGLKIDFITAGMDALKLSQRTEINLYRIVQEAMNNILKHAHAGKVTVSLTASHPSIFLRVQDEGVGYGTDRQGQRKKRGRHMGLQNMMERAAMLKGEFKIQSRKGEGTRILVKVPYEREEKSDAAENSPDCR